MKTDDDVMRAVRESVRVNPVQGGVTIEDVHDLPRLRAIEVLQAAVWGHDNRTVVPGHLLALTAHSGGIVLGAFDGSEPVGFAFGLLGRQGNRLYHASHMLGIHPRLQGAGIGVALKWRQRERALEQGLDLMTWTFDPLEARNAYFNLHKLGVVGREYREDFYGEMDDELNRGLPSDRLYVEWRLAHSPMPDARGCSPRSAVRIVTSSGERPVLAIPAEHPGVPVLIEAPRNIQQLKGENIEMAQAWRQAQRKAFTWAFGKGYLADDFRDGAFVLVPGDGIAL